MKTRVAVTFQKVHIIEDEDLVGPGNLFFQGEVNGSLTQSSGELKLSSGDDHSFAGWQKTVDLGPNDTLTVRFWGYDQDKIPNRQESLGEVMEDFSGPGFGMGSHTTTSNNGDFTLTYQIETTAIEDPVLPPSPTPSPGPEKDELDYQCCVDTLLSHINANKIYYNKALWVYQDPDERASYLFNLQYNGQPLLTQIENTPIAVMGEFVAFLLRDRPTDISVSERPEVRLVGLPTRGIFAETLLSNCNACEKRDVTRFWDWTESPCPDKAPTIEGVKPGPQGQMPNLQQGSMPNSVVNIVNPPNVPDPTGLAAALTLLGKGDAFRDMSGMQEVSKLVNGLASGAMSLAEAQEEAKNIKTNQSKPGGGGALFPSPSGGRATPNELNPAKQVDRLDAIQYAKAQGLVNDDEANDAAVALLGGAPLATSASPAQPLQEYCAFWSQNGVPVGEASLRDGVRLAAEAERNLWFDAAGSAIKEDANSQYGHLVRYWLGRFSDIPPVALAALQAKAVDGTINYGQFTPTATVNIVNTEAAQVRTDLMAAVTSAVPPTVSGRVETAVKNARLCGVILPITSRDAWSAIFVVSTVRKVAMQLGLEAEVAGVHQGMNVLLRCHEGHRIYVAEAFNRRAAGTRGTYHSFETTERAVQVGDIIVQDRQAITIGNVWSYAAIPALVTAGREMHCDIVVEVPPGGDHVIAIGGNLGNSARKRRYPVNADGELVVNREQYYTQESDVGVLDPIPALNAAAGLNTMSTGRIFALLSPVPVCVTIPVDQEAPETWFG